MIFGWPSCSAPFSAFYQLSAPLADSNTVSTHEFSSACTSISVFSWYQLPYTEQTSSTKQAIPFCRRFTCRFANLSTKLRATKRQESREATPTSIDTKRQTLLQCQYILSLSVTSSISPVHLELSLRVVRVSLSECFVAKLATTALCCASRPMSY